MKTKYILLISFTLLSFISNAQINRQKFPNVSPKMNAPEKQKVNPALSPGPNNNLKKQPQFVNYSFNQAQWVAGIGSIFNGLKIHLNNYTPVKNRYTQGATFAFQHSNSSSFQLPSFKLNLSFDIPVFRQNPYSLYVNDMNSSKVSTYAGSGYVYVTVSFEDNGPEIIGNCVQNISCVCGDPKMDLNNISIRIPLTVSPKNGAVVVGQRDISFRTNISETGPCKENACAFLCGIFAPNRKTQLVKAVEDYFGSTIDQYSGLISSAFNVFLQQKLGVKGEIISVIISQSGDLKITSKMS